jgi:hypothetical protein
MDRWDWTGAGCSRAARRWRWPPRSGPAAGRRGPAATGTGTRTGTVARRQTRRRDMCPGRPTTGPGSTRPTRDGTRPGSRRWSPSWRSAARRRWWSCPAAGSWSSGTGGPAASMSPPTSRPARRAWCRPCAAWPGARACSTSTNRCRRTCRRAGRGPGSATRSPSPSACPSLDLVVVRQGGAAREAAEARSSFDDGLLARLVAARA